MSRCLVVAKDDHLRSELQSFLQQQGETVSAAADATALHNEVSARSFDVVVLDVSVPGVGGVDASRWLGCRWGVPLVLLMPEAAAISRAACLELGADDCVADPFEPGELLACMRVAVQRARLREADEAPPRTVTFDDWRFDRVMRQLTSRGGDVIVLSNSETRLLEAFVDRCGCVLSRDRLVELTRAPGVEVNDRNIDLAVSHLRRKLGDRPRASRFIGTVRGEGYVFCGEVRSCG